MMMDYAGALTLHEHPDGGPVRLRANGRRHRPNGLYFSVKSGRHLPHESKLELHDLWSAEVRSDVVSSSPQPFTCSFVLDGVRRRYTPDRKDVLADGGVDIVEVKDVLSAAKDPLYARKLDHVACLLGQSGMRFVLREREAIEAEPRFSATETIQRYRRTQVTVSDLVRVQRLLADHRSVGLGEVQELFQAGPQGLAVICAMVVRRILHIDLSQGLHARAAVRLVS